MMDIEIVIDELVLENLTVQDPEVIREVIAGELGRLIANGGLPAHFSDGAAFSLLAAGPFEVPPFAAGESIGVQVAQTIYGEPKW
jgi:hypothetical protein